MSRITDLITAEYLRHCTNVKCEKCLARARWSRRKAWRSSKDPSRKNTRKEVMPS
jgi:hypothetical protein